ncbi:hypothetical protein EK21DRAFT_109525 [Setomelanomma holmii]|uniref:DUF7730 domain-containing protein n=1 Tax=Setomelanomma holmii TaxID=210430 RepID=A0A9P4HFT0_9PLEO|nr:hypothetical protein EK21DRAFT_109525 [Setomelanomma holmii]
MRRRPQVSWSDNDYYRNLRKGDKASRRKAIIIWIALLPVVPIICIGLGPFWAYHKYKQSEVYMDRVRTRAEQRDRTPPKLVRRKRALSIVPAPRRSTTTERKPLLSLLPTELRLQIYEHIVEREDGFHIVLVAGCLHGYRCQWSPDLTVPTRHQQCWYHYCNEQQSPTIISSKDTSRLGVLGLLQSCRAIYNDFVPHLYSRPRFLFHDYDSFAAFCGSIVPQRFNTIQRVQVYRASYGGRVNINPTHLTNNILSGSASYRSLHDSKVTIRTPVLPELMPPEGKTFLPEKWQQVRLILGRMEALKEVKAATFTEFAEHADTARNMSGEREAERWLRHSVDRLWFSEDGSNSGNWKDFDVSKEVFMNGKTWQAVSLRRKKHNG